MTHYLVTTRYVGGDNGLGRTRCFEQSSRCSFPVRRKYDAICLVNKLSDIARRPQVFDGTATDPLINRFKFDAALMAGVFGTQDLKTGVHSLRAKLFHGLNVLQHAFISDQS